VELVKGLERGYFARRDTGGSGPIDFGEYLNPDGTVKNSDMISVFLYDTLSSILIFVLYPNLACA